MGELSARKCWVGLDWGDSEHSICILDVETQKKNRFVVKHDPEGMALLHDKLSSNGEVQGICVETHNHLVVQHLLIWGFTVYSVNPKIVKAWRESVNVEPSKNDEIDADTMAMGLASFHTELRPFKPADPQTRELAMLCDDEADLIGDRTALVNQLQAALKKYYPQALDFFGDWTKKSAWDFLIKYPNPGIFMRATKKGLIGFLKAHRIGITETWQQRIDSRTAGERWLFDEAVSRAKEMQAVSLARHLIRLQATLDGYRKRINKLFNTQPDAGIFLSLPGCGEKLAPRMLSFFGADRERFDSAEIPQQLSGVVPVSKVTGGKKKKPNVKFRRAVRKQYRNMMHLFAWCSINNCQWANAFYKQARERGDDQALALRKLGAKWLKIIYRMWKTGERYDEAKYLNAMIVHGSPLVAYMKQAS